MRSCDCVLSWKAPSEWHPDVETCRRLIFVMNCILLSASVGRCINCNNRYCLNTHKHRLWVLHAVCCMLYAVTHSYELHSYNPVINLSADMSHRALHTARWATGSGRCVICWFPAAAYCGLQMSLT